MTPNGPSPTPATAELRVPCCPGIPSGYIDPQGVEARMCDEVCECYSCLLCRDFGE